MQQGLFTTGALGPGELSARRVSLGRGAWIARHPQWLRGQAELFDRLRDTTSWKATRRVMYDREVDVPRLLASPPLPLDPVLDDIQQRLLAHTGWTLDRITLALYRDGRDSVAWHGDRMGPLRTDCVMAIVSLGAPRRFLLRPIRGGRSRTLHLHGGDLLVLGGTIHDTFEHSVPKESWAGPRIALMFRPSSRPDSPVAGSLTGSAAASPSPLRRQTRSPGGSLPARARSVLSRGRSPDYRGHRTGSP